MNEQDDKSFHNWVRQSLDTYRPPYEPQDWTELQRTLKRRQWWRNGFIGGSIVLIVLLVNWLLPTSTENRSNTRGAVTIRQTPILNKRLPDKFDTTAISTFQPSELFTGTEKAINQRKSSADKTKLPHSFQSEHKPLAEQIVASDITPRINLPATQLTAQIQSVTSVVFSPEETSIKEQMVTGDFGPDSTSYYVLARNLRQWSNAVLVCDLTSSMYPYTTQLFALLKQYAHDPSIQGIVFFTDCDSLGQQTYVGGPPGRMFVTRERNSTNILPVLVSAARNTVHNTDDAENDVEALLFAQKEFPQARHLILVADNISTVKDMVLLNTIKKPVHVLLCGTTGSDTARAFQTDYYTIARQTNGSLHTLEDDFSPSTISAGTTLRVGTRYYRYSTRRKQFKLTSFNRRPRRFLRFLWL